MVVVVGGLAVQQGVLKPLPSLQWRQRAGHGQALPQHGKQHQQSSKAARHGQDSSGTHQFWLDACGDVGIHCGARLRRLCRMASAGFAMRRSNQFVQDAAFIRPVFSMALGA